VAKAIRALCVPVALASVVVVAACSSSPSPSSTSSPSAPAAQTGPALPTSPSKTAESVTETGSTLLFPLMGTWATAYQKLWPQVTLTTGGTGSGTGIADASTGTVDIGASDAYLSASERDANPSLLNIALAISAQQINYNLPGIKTLKLDGQVLAEIYTGKITKWNNSAIAALNPGVNLPSMTIVPLRRLDSSGDTFLFTSYLNAQAPTIWPASNVGTTISWPAVAGETSETGNGGMVSGCGSTKGCIAYIGISYLAKSQAAGLGDAELKNAAGNFVPIDSTTVAAAAAAQTAKTPANQTISLINGPGANSYPIINYEYAIIDTKQTNAVKAEDIRAFLHWTVTTGQNATTYLDPVDFQPLPSSVVAQSNAQISKIGA
jgi:phosphate transport system substrate-binding protein